MANPNRVAFYARRTFNSDYRIFSKFGEANTFADNARAAGYTKVRVTQFRVGSNARRDYNWRVSIYWDDKTQAAPDMKSFGSSY